MRLSILQKAVKTPFLAVLAAFTLFGLLVYADASAQSGRIILNMTVIGGGGGHVESDDLYGGSSIAVEGLSGRALLSSTVENSSFSFFDTVNRSFVLRNISGVDVFVWNGSVWKNYEDQNVIWRDCRVGDVNCQPRYQNATPENQTKLNLTNGLFNGTWGVMNVTSTGSAGVDSVEFRVDVVCPWINLTFTNSSNRTHSPLRDLNASFSLLHGSLDEGESFELFVFGNFSSPNQTCTGSEYEFRVI